MDKSYEGLLPAYQKKRFCFCKDHPMPVFKKASESNGMYRKAMECIGLYQKIQPHPVLENHTMAA
jgi:hypothetical protein